jgi:hypothetical protein
VPSNVDFVKRAASSALMGRHRISDVNSFDVL